MCALKLFTLVVGRSSFGREFQSVGAATIKALSPNVFFDRTAGIESKILPEDLRLYKDDLKAHVHPRCIARPVLQKKHFA